MKKIDFSYYLTSFLGKYLPGQKNASPNTIESYAETFKLLLTYCEEKKKVKPQHLNLSFLTRDIVIGFLDWIEKERGCTISTRNQRLVPLHSFFRYVQKESCQNLYEIQKILNIPNKKTPKTIVPFLTGEEMKILLEKPDTTSIAFPNHYINVEYFLLLRFHPFSISIETQWGFHLLHQGI